MGFYFFFVFAMLFIRKPYATNQADTGYDLMDFQKILFLQGFSLGFCSVMPRMLMKSWKKKVAFTTLNLLANIIGIGPSFFAEDMILVVFCFLHMISMNYYYYHVQIINNDYFAQLDDKIKETRSWHKLIKNLPEGIACFDGQFDSLYINTAAENIFRV